MKGYATTHAFLDHVSGIRAAAHEGSIHITMGMTSLIVDDEVAARLVEAITAARVALREPSAGDICHVATSAPFADLDEVREDHAKIERDYVRAQEQG